MSDPSIVPSLLLVALDTVAIYHESTALAHVQEFLPLELFRLINYVPGLWLAVNSCFAAIVYPKLLNFLSKYTLRGLLQGHILLWGMTTVVIGILTPGYCKIILYLVSRTVLSCTFILVEVCYAQGVIFNTVSVFQQRAYSILWSMVLLWAFSKEPTWYLPACHGLFAMLLAIVDRKEVKSKPLNLCRADPQVARARSSWMPLKSQSIVFMLVAAGLGGVDAVLKTYVRTVLVQDSSEYRVYSTLNWGAAIALLIGCPEWLNTLHLRTFTMAKLVVAGCVLLTVDTVSVLSFVCLTCLGMTQIIGSAVAKTAIRKAIVTETRSVSMQLVAIQKPMNTIAKSIALFAAALPVNTTIHDETSTSKVSVLTSMFGMLTVLWAFCPSCIVVSESYRKRI